MNQVFQLGLKAFVTPAGFAVTPRNFRIGTFVSFRAMKPKRHLASSSKPASSFDNMEDEKVNRLVGSTPKDIGVESDEAGIQSVKDNPERIEVMTVQELRTILRSIGVPAKGSKRDLVSALKVYVEKKMDVGSSHVEIEEVSSISAESVSVKRKANTKSISGERKAKKFSHEEHAQEIYSVPEVSALQESKRRAKKSPIGDETGEVDAKASVKTDKISVTLPTVQSEPWTMLAHKKPQKGWIAYNPRTMRPPPLAEGTKSVKLLSWNVNGLRALLKLEGFSVLQLAQRENFDVLCLQETKLQEKDVKSIKQCLLDGYENSFWTCSTSKLGYSGTAIISRIKPLSVTYGLGISDHDSEGRLVTAEFDSFFLLSCYVPNSGDGLRRLSYRIREWDPSLSSYVKELEKKKPVILTGDLNCAHQEIDIYNPAGNRRSAGFTDEERQSFGANFLSKGFVDTFRAQHPGVVGYTYWGYRHGGRKTNRGWRLDYFLVSQSLADKFHDSYILPDVTGSDHSPIGLILKL
ncbi:DNA-(apurinic or apyrimidinic site) lyase, chloroplastic isoform X1 [Citrus clementina]|uniref:DNA-(apurinic or apyrimidinic site) lyase, chloroplastic isoform X1 n=2 Tax=Citrus clementina TaxID=85681 RepID=UPI000CED661D|nr:DNA-(apurinic or apyrimidinic site) lyase, chloroplastic isoform X1 [Citrus x clementina]